MGFPGRLNHHINQESQSIYFCQNNQKGHQRALPRRPGRVLPQTQLPAAAAGRSAGQQRGGAAGEKQPQPAAGLPAREEQLTAGGAGVGAGLGGVGFGAGGWVWGSVLVALGGFGGFSGVGGF